MSDRSDKPSKEGRKRISEKIAYLRREEGKTASQAAGEAYGEERQGRLGRGGSYHRVGKRANRRISRR